MDDGSPTTSAPLSLKAGNDNPLYRQDQVNQLTNLIDQTRADNPEVDLLAAISLVARSVTEAVGPKTIVVIDSGLQTTGALRFQDQDGALLNANPDEVVELLRRTQQLPNLTGMRVVFTGLGDTAAPQQPLPAPARAVLADYAREITNGRRALLTGTTASAGTSEYRLRLSQERANAVRWTTASRRGPGRRR